MRLWHEPFAVPWMKTVTSLLTNYDRARKERQYTSEDYVTAVLEELRRRLRPCLQTARGRHVAWPFSDSFATGSFQIASLQYPGLGQPSKMGEILHCWSRSLSSEEVLEVAPVSRWSRSPNCEEAGNYTMARCNEGSVSKVLRFKTLFRASVSYTTRVSSRSSCSCTRRGHTWSSSL